MNFLKGNFEEPDQQGSWLLLRQITLKIIYYSECLGANVFDMIYNCFYIVFEKTNYIRHLVYKKRTSTKCW